jgi:DNA-directed RNA polymerase specialized sigma subunit
VFHTRDQIVDALERIEEGLGTVSTSIVAVDHTKRDPDADPFHPGFLSAFERRTQVLELLRGLDERSRRLLVLWFVHGRPVGEIAGDLGISRVHCYRLRNKALDEMIDAHQGSREPVQQAG